MCKLCADFDGNFGAKPVLSYPLETMFAILIILVVLYFVCAWQAIKCGCGWEAVKWMAALLAITVATLIIACLHTS